MHNLYVEPCRDETCDVRIWSGIGTTVPYADAYNCRVTRQDDADGARTNRAPRTFLETLNIIGIGDDIKSCRDRARMRTYQNYLLVCVGLR
jgi:hypothetical protein